MLTSLIAILLFSLTYHRWHKTTSGLLLTALCFITTYALLIFLSLILLVIHNEYGHQEEFSVLIILLALAFACFKVFKDARKKPRLVDLTRPYLAPLIYLCTSLSVTVKHDSLEASSKQITPQITKVLNIVTCIYFFSLVLLNIVSSVTNGDSQAYNLPRLYALLLTKSLVLKSTGIPTQAFHSFGHDMLYLPDLMIGNLRGLGLVNVFELAFLFILVDQSLLFPYLYPPISCKLQVRRVCARALLLSMAPLFYQATTPKNDLVLAPLTYCLGIFLYILSNKTIGKLAQTTLSRMQLASSAYLTILLSYVSKGYGIITSGCVILAQLLVYSSAKFLSRSRSHSPSTIQYSIRLPGSKGLSFIILSIPIIIYLVFFLVNRNIYWNVEYSVFVQGHSAPPSLLVPAFMNNILRNTIELVLNGPLPFQLDLSQLPLFSDASFSAGQTPYKIGGMINEDTAWPGYLFAITLILSILHWTNCFIKRIPKCSSFPVLSSKLSLPSFFAIAAFLSYGLLSSVLFWQPFSSRFFIATFALMIPSMSSAMADLLYRGHTDERPPT